jgi:phosphoribosylamine--glycine ligase
MSDLLTALVAARDGELAHFDLRWRTDAALSVVMAARGYPGEVAKGSEIRGLADAEQVEGVTLFHAGTRRDGDRILADGGRVLDVTAVAPTLAEARTRAYAAVDRIRWPDGFCRRDIGRRAV